MAANPAPVPAPASDPPGAAAGEPSSPAAAASRLSPGVGALLVAVVAAAASWNVLLNGFVWDDVQNIIQNRWVREPGRVWEAFLHQMAAFDPKLGSSYYRPVMHVVFAGTYTAAGPRPWAFHAVVLATHAAMAACVYLVLARWARPWPQHAAAAGAAAPPRLLDSLTSGPLVAALLFAVHPVHAPAVAWIAGIVDISYSLLFVVALLAATYEGPRRAVPLVAAPAAFFLALLAKEPAVMLLPVAAVAFACRGAWSDRARRRDAVVRLSVLAAVLVPYLALRVNALGGLLPERHEPIHLGVVDGAATALALFFHYATALVAPIHMSLLHDIPIVPRILDGRALAGAAAAAVLLAVVWRLRRDVAAVVGATILVLPILPALHVPFVGFNAGAERYAYLPSAGGALLLSSAIEAWRRRGGPRAAAVRLAIGAGAAVALVLGTAATLAHDAVWRDELSLWSDTAAKVPASAMAQEELGNALLASGATGAAVAALERAVALDPARSTARVNLASALVFAGRADEGLAAALEGVRRAPRVAEAHAVVGTALAATGRAAEAATAFEQALSLNPALAEAHEGAAGAYAQLGRKDLAMAHMREAVRLQPENARFRRNLAWLARP